MAEKYYYNQVNQPIDNIVNQPIGWDMQQLPSNTVFTNPVVQQNLPNTINGNDIAVKSIKADKISVWELSALAAFLGTVQIGTSGHLRGGMSAYNTGTWFWLGYDTTDNKYKFSIGTTGQKLTFDGTDLTITGSITASSGTIGWFTITWTSLYGWIIKTAATVWVGYTGVIMDTSGLRGYDSVLGNTFNLPTDGSAPTFASGIINETVFNISTNAVLRTSSTAGDGSASSAGVLINNTGIYGCGANQTLSTANFRILNTGGGSMTFSSTGFVRGGQTDFATGDGFFLGYSGTDYKFSVGDSSNYMQWDGTYLRLKGSFDVGTKGLINNSSYSVANLPVINIPVGFNFTSGNDY